VSQLSRRSRWLSRALQALNIDDCVLTEDYYVIYVPVYDT